MSIPTTSDLYAQYLASFESSFGQTAPLNEKSFFKVLSAALAGGDIGIYKALADSQKQIFTQTATGEGLDIIGAKESIVRTPAEAAQFTITLPAIEGVIIPLTVDFSGIPNGVRYAVDAPATTTGGVATIQVTAKDSGTVGNLNVGDQMRLGVPVSGAESIATITVQTNTGTNEESDEDLQTRIEDKQRGVTGGGNNADYRLWSQEVAGVDRAYPFNGNPIDDISDDLPLERVVYIKADESIDPDGIPPVGLLAEVRDAINTDPATGIARPMLGQVDALLYVEPIVRTPIDINIYTLVIDSTLETQVKLEIEAALSAYLFAKEPFVEGLDPAFLKDNYVTSADISKLVMDVLSGYGGIITKSSLTLNTFELEEHTLRPNQTLKLGSVVYPVE